MASSPLQNRVVGTVCVVALAVIILPDLFGNAGQTQQDDFQVTPLSPTIDSQMQSPDFPSDFSTVSANTNNTIVVPIIDAMEDDAAGNEQIENHESGDAPDSAAASDRWVIQLGAFRNAEAVEQLLNTLRQAGFAADSRVLRRSEGPLHLVLVGPHLNKEVLNSQLSELKELTQLNGKVVPYQPANN